MSCFIKKIFNNEFDENVHKQFVRFGKGEYNSRAVINLRKSKNIKLTSTFEYANDFINLLKDFQLQFSGIIISKNEIPSMPGRKKSGMREYQVNLSSDELKKINGYYYLLLDAYGEGISFKVKKKLPKPGKSGEKVDDKFCILEADVRYWQKIKEHFLWDVPENVKKARITHTYMISEIILPESEKDPEKIRVLSKRKGRILRNIELDNQIIKNEHELVA